MKKETPILYNAHVDSPTHNIYLNAPFVHARNSGVNIRNTLDSLATSGEVIEPEELEETGLEYQEFMRLLRDAQTTGSLHQDRVPRFGHLEVYSIFELFQYCDG